LILPDSECLSDRQLEIIRGFVEKGGGLLAIGQSGLYDDWRRLRLRPGLSGLVDNQVRARAYEENVQRTVAAGAPVRKEVKQGRVAYMPGLNFDGPMPERENYFSISAKYWKLPRNWRDMVESVRWAAKDELPARVEGPAYLVSNLVSQPGKRRAMVHLVNYGRKSTPSIASVEVRCRLPQGEKVKGITIYSPDSSAAPATLEGTQSGSEVVFKVPDLKVYSIAVVSW
jgi:hypothetical protein